MKKLKLKWTCSDYVRHHHAHKWQAHICGLWQQAILRLWWQIGGAVAPKGIAPVSVRCINGVDAGLSTADAYYELIYAVESKHDGESRHATALRYIRQAETRSESAQASTG